MHYMACELYFNKIVKKSYDFFFKSELALYLLIWRDAHDIFLSENREFKGIYVLRLHFDVKNVNICLSMKNFPKDIYQTVNIGR